MSKMKDLAIDKMNTEQHPEWFVARIDSMDYVLKNKLEKCIREEVEKFDRWLIPAAEVELFKKLFRDRINQANIDNPRCKAVKLNIWLPNEYTEDHIERHDIKFSLSMNLHLMLYAMKGFPMCTKENGMIIIY